MGYNSTNQSNFSFQFPLSSHVQNHNSYDLSNMFQQLNNAWNSSNLVSNTFVFSGDSLYFKVSVDFLNATLPNNYWNLTGFNNDEPVLSWKSWLVTQYANAIPLIVYYQLATSVDEPISLPSIKIYDDNTNITVTDGNMTPSNISMSYYTE